MSVAESPFIALYGFKHGIIVKDVHRTLQESFILFVDSTDRCIENFLGITDVFFVIFIIAPKINKQNQ